MTNIHQLNMFVDVMSQSLCLWLNWCRTGALTILELVERLLLVALDDITTRASVSGIDSFDRDHVTSDIPRSKGQMLAVSECNGPMLLM